MIDLAQLKCLGEGRNRIVYLLPSGRNVIKVPKNEDGFDDNYLEDFRYRRNRSNWYPLARCRLFDYTRCILVMEYVELVDKPYDMGESWVYSVDGGQVGINRSGKLVAYDYGN